MKDIRHVVAATDFSAGARAALACAVWLAQRHGATLDLVHAFDDAAWPRLKAVFDAKRLAGQTPPDVALRERLGALATTLHEQTGLAVEAHFGVGEPAEALARLVRAHPASVVVIGRRADPATPGVGSTLLRVLREVPAPVWVVRGAAPPAGNGGRGGERGIERVLAATDLRELSLRAAQVALRLFPDAQQRWLCAIDPAWERELWRTGELQSPLREAQRSLHDEAAQRLAVLAAEAAAAAGVAVPVTQVEDGVPVRVILAQAVAWPADCLAVGRRGQGVLADRLVGSTALDLLHHAACDVLVVP